MSIVIGRPIEGISLNGNEFLLNDDGELMEFNTVKDAQTFLGGHGVEGDDLEDCFVYRDITDKEVQYSLK